MEFPGSQHHVDHEYVDNDHLHHEYVDDIDSYYEDVIDDIAVDRAA